MKVLAMILTSIISSFLARILLGAGLTFITYDWVSDLLDELIEKADRSLNQLPQFSMSLIKLLELDVCASMLLSTIQLVIFIHLAKMMVGKST